ncbi:hypothetical protein ZWY2020_044280 [Hordeum vulgare]|nr:hypothetical protein ZWY2020_044280 [Hordeum vulgare]
MKVEILVDTGREEEGPIWRARGGRDNGWRNGDQVLLSLERKGAVAIHQTGETVSLGVPMKAPSHVMKIRPPLGTPQRIKNCLEVNKMILGRKMIDKGQEQPTDAWSSKTTSTAGAENNDGWNTKAKESTCNTGAKWENAASGEGQQGDPWSSKISSTAKGKEQKTDPWASKVSSTAAEEKTDPWNTKGGNGNDGGWNNAGSSWGKASSSSGDQEPAWNKPKYGDDSAGFGRGGFGRGNGGRGRGRFGDSGSSWNGGSNTDDGSGGGRSEDHWNRRDSDGGRGRGEGRFGRGDCNQVGAPPGNTTAGALGSAGGGGSWGKSNEDTWNSSKGTGGSEGGSKKEGSWDKAEGGGAKRRWRQFLGQGGQWRMGQQQGQGHGSDGGSGW